MTDMLSKALRAALRLLRLIGVAGGLVLFASAPAHAHSDVAPYLEVQQVLDAELNDGGDVLTYTSVAAGVDATVSTRRVQAQISYRYERRIAWNHNIEDEDVHSGLAQARIEIAPEVLMLDAGAIAARGRADPRGPGFGFTSADNRNIADVYAGYIGPSLATHVGPLAVNASYHLGYVKVDDHDRGGSPFPGGPLDRYDSSTSHTVQASVGMAPGELPVGWTIAAGYDRENAKRLKHRFEGKFVRGDVVVPVSPTFAVTGGIGYEKMESSQQDFLRDSNGLPVTTPGGNLIADPSKPRLLAYDQSGFIWDAGVIWRPSPRTELTVRGGQRYGDTTVVGTLKYQFSRDFAFSAVVYDSVTSFGRLLVSDINGLPTNFKVNNRGLNAGNFGGCVFGNDPGSGHCLGDALDAISGHDFRNRGIGLLLSGSRGRWDLELGAGYAQRKYLAADTGLFSLHGVKDDAAIIEGRLGRALTRRSGLDFDAYAEWYDSGIAGNDTVFSTGVTGTYYRDFLIDRLQAQASVGIYTSNGNSGDSTVASALLGLRYNF
jgi:hypothetical protein